MFAEYVFVLWGLWAMFLMVLLQSAIAAVAHRKQSHYVPGVVDKGLGHESFVFRSHRTFLNSLENLMMMAGPAFVAILAGMDPTTLAALVWAWVGARVLHMALYYVIATEKNPSPRSYFYTLALLANGALFVMLAMHLAGS